MYQKRQTHNTTSDKTTAVFHVGGAIFERKCLTRRAVVPFGCSFFRTPGAMLSSESSVVIG